MRPGAPRRIQAGNLPLPSFEVRRPGSDGRLFHRPRPFTPETGPGHNISAAPRVYIFRLPDRGRKSDLRFEQIEDVT